MYSVVANYLQQYLIVKQNTTTLEVDGNTERFCSPSIHALL